MSDNSEYTPFDAYLFHEGTHTQLYRKLGAHPCRVGSKDGIVFRVWAPHAKEVCLVTDSNEWDPGKGKMKRSDDGVWEIQISDAKPGDTYRYRIVGTDQTVRYKSDPYAFYSEVRPKNASVITGDSTYQWHDREWIKNRKELTNRPVSVYEVQLGSWKRNELGYMNYRELGRELSEYVHWMGFTHVELMGICEYPFDGSWGYQVSGYYSPTSRYGTPDELRELVDTLHGNGIGVFMDWVPAHFVKDEFALREFDGSFLYEPSDPDKREYPEWGTCAFDYSKPEIRSFLISNALYWIREFHMDGLRVDAVASMLYLDYGRSRWTPNCYGDNRCIEGRDFLKQFNDTVHRETGAITVAEDSSIETGITVPVNKGGYGFDFKWNMGWMNDTLKYMEKDPIYRKYHHNQLTHVSDYAFTEKFVLVLSHDEVVHLKKSMFGKMPGTIADRLGNLKALYALQYAQPGKKLLFMGQEFGAESEWNENREIEWPLAENKGHREILISVRQLNRIYSSLAPLWKWDDDPGSFQWSNANDSERNILSFIRKNPGCYDEMIIFAANFSRTLYSDYCIGVPQAGSYERIFSSYDSTEGGGGPEETGNGPILLTVNESCTGFPAMIRYSLRPNEAVLFLRKD